MAPVSVTPHSLPLTASSIRVPPRMAGTKTLPPADGGPCQCFNGAADTRLDMNVILTSHALQWGRGFTAADTCWRIFQSSFESVQLQWGRGFTAADTSSLCSQCLYPPFSLQWGRGFTAADTCSVRSKGAGPIGFNGAAASQPRIPLDAKTGLLTLTIASMGPRLHSRGYIPAECSPRPFVMRLQWGRGFTAADTSRWRQQPR